MNLAIFNYWDNTGLKTLVSFYILAMLSYSDLCCTFVMLWINIVVFGELRKHYLLVVKAMAKVEDAS